VINLKAVRRQYPEMPGTVMFPTTHDVTPWNLPNVLIVLRTLLRAGNRVLLVSKPHIECVRAICVTLDADEAKLGCWRERFEFRFTLGGCGGPAEVRRAYWEPGAPTIGERWECLKRAKAQGFRTSVSCEPAIALSTVPDLVHFAERHVTETIWIGLMRNIRSRVAIRTAEDERQVRLIEAEQTEANVRELYEKLKDHPKVRWKDSIKQLLGLPPATAPEE
jgi:hypothetical protein